MNYLVADLIAKKEGRLFSWRNEMREFIFFCFIVTSTSIYAQKSATVDSLSHQKFMTLVNANREQSYVTFGSGLGNLEPLLFEARLSPSYFFTGREKKWALMLNPQVQLRMLDKKSFPIRNPSYKISIDFYHDLKFWKESFLRKIFYRDALWYASVTHHSNGQDGEFYKADTISTLNLDDGSFATNYLQFGISSYKLKTLGKDFFSIREVKTYAEIHPPKWSIQELDDRYGYYRVFTEIGFIGPMRKLKNNYVNRWLQESSLQLRSGWIFGRMNNASPGDARRRLIIDFTYKYYPRWFDEVAFFVRFYRGQDYYNIYFSQNELTTLTCGLTSNIMNFKKAVKYLK